MNNDHPKRSTMSIEEASISNIWEMEAIVEVFGQKGLYAKQDLHSPIDELRHKNPYAKIPETAFPKSAPRRLYKPSGVADLTEQLGNSK